jgi:hypothetical protein
MKETMNLMQYFKQITCYIDLIERRIQLYETFVESDGQRTAHKIKLIISSLN